MDIIYNYVQTTLPQCTYKMDDVNMDGTVNQSDLYLTVMYEIFKTRILSLCTKKFYMI